MEVAPRLPTYQGFGRPIFTFSCKKHEFYVEYEKTAWKIINSNWTDESKNWYTLWGVHCSFQNPQLV